MPKPSRALSVLPLALCSGLIMCHSPSSDSQTDVYARLPHTQPARHYTIPRAPGPVTINGDIHKTVWQAAPWTEDFVDIEGHLKPHPPLRTRVKMMWDDENLYFAAELEEPHIWATLTQRDSVIFHDNDFEVFLYPGFDPKNPGAPVRNYYEFEINALNTVWDLCLPKPYREGGNADNSWTIEGLQTAVKVRGTLNNPTDTDQGWDVEIAMPFKAFNRHRGMGLPAHGSSTDISGGAMSPQPPRPGDLWKLNFSRVEWDTQVTNNAYVKIPNRPEHNWVWSPMGLIDMHVPQRWGIVEFGK
jgi:hypothetical protein